MGETEGEADTDTVRVTELLAEADGLGEDVSVAELDRVCVDDSEGDAVGDPLLVPLVDALADLDKLSEAVSDGDRLADTLREGDGESVAELDTLSLSVAD